MQDMESLVDYLKLKDQNASSAMGAMTDNLQLSNERSTFNFCCTFVVVEI
jgi:hypothetical protein